MGRHYSPKEFFRQTPNPLLQRYFHAKELFLDIDFAALDEANPEKLFKAFLALPEDIRNPIDSEFLEIFELANEKGTLAIADEAKWHYGSDLESFAVFVGELSAMENHYERAMVTFLDHQKFWKGATRFYHADTLTHWRKRKNLPKVEAAVDEESRKALADGIRDYFHNTEGRGNNCIVEPLRRGDLDYFFAYPEDYSQRSTEWVGGEFRHRPHNPAFEVVFVYSEVEGSLDINFKGNYKAIEPMQGIFAEAILKADKLPPDPDDTRVYDLDPLGQRGFAFLYDPAKGIQDVRVKKLRFSSFARKGDRITLEADSTQRREAVYDLLDTIARSVNMSIYNVTQVELSAKVEVEKNKPPKTFPIRLTHPNSCSLKYDAVGLKLRAMLVASGIEPREPPKEVELSEA